MKKTKTVFIILFFCLSLSGISTATSEGDSDVGVKWADLLPHVRELQTAGPVGLARQKRWRFR
jgi:hypothetical protein